MTERKFGTPKTLQWAADTNRLLKIALRSHDPKMLSQVEKRISKRLGPEIAERAVLTEITNLIETEDWSFFDPQTGEPSPLL